MSITKTTTARYDYPRHSLGADDYAIFQQEAQPFVALIERIDADLNAIDTQLMPAVYIERRNARLARGLDEFRALEARVTAFAEKTATAREKTLAGLVKTRGAGGVELPGWVSPTVSKDITALDEARHAEIRSLVRSMPALERDRLYEGAVEADNDPELVLAIERAPRAFPLVSPGTLQRAQERKIDRSPEGARVRSLEAVLGALRVFVDATRAELTAFGQVEQARGRA